MAFAKPSASVIDLQDVLVNSELPRLNQHTRHRPPQHRFIMSYRNPILSGFNPDPSIVFADGAYYIATSTFQYFPGVPIYRSTDLVDWKLIGHALNRPSQLQMRTTEGGGGIFAPTLRHHKGRFYMTTCCAHRIRFGTTDVRSQKTCRCGASADTLSDIAIRDA